MLTSDFKDLISIKLKSRHDDISDQYNRVFMVKVLFASSMFIGLSWFRDSIVCIVPEALDISPKFVSDTCWIQGVYVYKELANMTDHTSYYGMPKDISYTGIFENGQLCKAERQNRGQQHLGPCQPLRKTFYTQYQWMPFYVASLSALFYLPYMIHLLTNSDLISLKCTLKEGDKDADKIVKAYFNHKINPTRVMRIKVVVSFLIKISYIAVNIIALVLTNTMLNDEYQNYGRKWISWANMEDSAQYDYTTARNSPKPGNTLFPPLGFCELYESVLDYRTSKHNKHRFVCEMTQHVLYQYVFLFLWFLFHAGIIISVMGLLFKLLGHATTLYCLLRQGSTAKKIYRMLTIRECQYLEYIRKKDMPLYGQVIQKLKIEKFGGGTSQTHDYMVNMINMTGYTDQTTTFPVDRVKSRSRGELPTFKAATQLSGRHNTQLPPPFSPESPEDPKSGEKTNQRLLEVKETEVDNVQAYND